MRGLAHIIILIFLSSVVSGQHIKGVSIVGPFNDVPVGEHMPMLDALGTEWLAFTPDHILENGSFRITEDLSDWTLSMEQLGLKIKEAHNAGYKVFLKPHIILSREESPSGFAPDDWRGTLQLKNNEWVIVEQEYEALILSFAAFAEDHKVDLFCIGTELNSFVKNRKDYWEHLINDIRDIYTGPITYSANWDDYEAPHIWDAVDIIGVNAYFPLGSKKQIHSKFLRKKWSKILKPLEAIAKRYNKQILITEVGYRSVESSSLTPWIHNNPDEMSSESTQNILIDHMLEAIYQSDWIIGSFVWNYPYKITGQHKTDFSIRNKPAFDTISKWYNL